MNKVRRQTTYHTYMYKPIICKFQPYYLQISKYVWLQLANCLRLAPEFAHTEPQGCWGGRAAATCGGGPNVVFIWGWGTVCGCSFGTRFLNVFVLRNIWWVFICCRKRL